MKNNFILILKSPWGVIGDRVIAPFKIPQEVKRNSNQELFVCVIVKVTEDFKEDGLTVLASDTDSIQIRPKQVFKNTKGYYYKVLSKPVYLETDQVLNFLAQLNLVKETIITKLKGNKEHKSVKIY